MAYDFTLTAVIPATPAQIYEAWLDSRRHGAMTGGKAKQSATVGDAVTAWDGYITGRNLALKPDKRIVQSWRTSEFAAGDADSVITVTLARSARGTRLTLKHANVPDGQTSYERGGWQENYFEPMTSYFRTISRTGKKSAPKPARKRSPKASPARRTGRTAAAKRDGKSTRAARRRKQR